MNEGKLKKNMPTLVILSISGALIYALPYFRNYYYDTFLEAFKLTNTQMGTLGSAYGVCCLISYVFGGYCADRWKTKNLLMISLITTGILGFSLLTYPPYPVLLGIHAAWGITSILTFWSALVKAVRSLASENEQGKAFGFFEGGRGITNIVQSIFVLAIFAFFSKRMSEKMALSAVIIVYSVICLILAVAIMLLYKEVEEENKEEGKTSFDWNALKKILKMKTTWVAALIIFPSYAMIVSYYYITPYASLAFGTTAVISAAIGYLSQYCRPIGCMGAGVIGDKIGVSNMVIISYILMILGIGALILVPGKPSMIFMLLISIALIYTTMYALQALHFAILSEADYPVEVTGAVTMPLMMLGYSPEIIMPIIAGKCIDKFQGILGYKVFFGILLGLAIAGVVFVLIWKKITKEYRMSIKVKEEKTTLEA
ncbi:MFS transporter [Peptacetobacter sp.]|uniref:MFS transporter n=1 Tax=Peptacetobacter sp. TaxID=2991975 RepID=UPI00260BEFF6|nr:MFS transporter [Peptacetobacter sp.]